MSHLNCISHFCEYASLFSIILLFLTFFYFVSGNTALHLAVMLGRKGKHNSWLYNSFIITWQTIKKSYGSCEVKTPASEPPASMELRCVYGTFQRL